METGIIFSGSPSYKVEKSPELGRYLVATRDIKKGEVILTDTPLVVGPIKGTVLSCPGCYQPPQTDCEKCGWPVCSSECPGIAKHQAECQFLQEKQSLDGIPSYENDWHKLADCLMVLRCLLLKRYDERRWRRLLEMETNWEKWSRSPLQPLGVQMEEFVRNQYYLTEQEFPSNDFLTVQAILDINAFEVRLPEVNMQVAYKLASLLEHSCLPNTLKTICGKTLDLTLRAETDIPQGSHITTTYCDILWPTSHRQQYLQWSKFFICSCDRCNSPTECDSHLASLICMECYSKDNTSTVLPSAVPLIAESQQAQSWEIINKIYQCTSCSSKIPAWECQLISKKAADQLAELDKYASFETIETYEAWLDQWTLLNRILPPLLTPDDNNDKKHEDEECVVRKETSYTAAARRLLLHPQHSLVLDACHTLFLLYPRVDCTLACLKRKECFGTHLLHTTKPFTGISRFSGTISYELAMTKAEILVYQLEQSGVTDNLRHLAQEVLQLLGDSQELLKYEPLDQPEGKLAQRGASQLEQLTVFFAQLFG